MKAEPREWSLRRRLLGWLLVATAIMGGLALLDTRIEAQRTAEQLSDRVLAGSAMVIAERAGLGPEGALEIAIPWGALEMLSSAAQDRVFYRVDGDDGLITGYEDLPVADARPGMGPAFRDAIYRGERVRIATLARALSTGIDARLYTVTLAETARARERLRDDILLRSALRLGGMILGAALIAWIVVTLSLRPLARLGEAIGARNPGDLRPLDTPVPSEIEAPLRAVNSLMADLDRALQALRNFTGNAAHQLRTPMAVMRTHLALAERAGCARSSRQALADAGTALHRAERVLEQLLALARVDGMQRGLHDGRSPGQVVDVVPLLRDQTASHVPAAAEAGLDLGFDAPEGAALHVRIEPLLLAEALGNLISNARVHARGGHEITVRLAQRDDRILITVEDDGPGIAPERIEQMPARFARAEAGPEVPGMGLGLAVVHEIVSLFGGQFDLGSGPAGHGVHACISLPLQDPPETG